MTRSWLWGLAALILALPGSAAAKDKVKREKARVALPIVVEAPARPGGVQSFRAGEVWGAQPARYRGAIVLDGPVRASGIPAPLIAGDRLVELQAYSKGFRGPLYCKAVALGGKQWPLLACLADRDRDGALDQLWTGRAASLEAVVPYPDVRSLAPVEPVRYRAMTDPSSLGLQIGFHVSGKNPLLGQHHLYSALARSGKLAFVLHETHKAVTLGDLPKSISLGGGAIIVESLDQGVYRAQVTRPIPPGERLVVSAYPVRTLFIPVTR